MYQGLLVSPNIQGQAEKTQDRILSKQEARGGSRLCIVLLLDGHHILVGIGYLI